MADQAPDGARPQNSKRGGRRNQGRSNRDADGNPRGRNQERSNKDADGKPRGRNHGRRAAPALIAPAPPQIPLPVLPQGPLHSFGGASLYTEEALYFLFKESEQPLDAELFDGGEFLKRVFENARIAYAFFGGFAMKMRGQSDRETKDIDILVNVEINYLHYLLLRESRFSIPKGCARKYNSGQELGASCIQIFIHTGYIDEPQEGVIQPTRVSAKIFRCGGENSNKYHLPLRLPMGSQIIVTDRFMGQNRPVWVIDITHQLITKLLAHRLDSGGQPNHHLSDILHLLENYHSEIVTARVALDEHSRGVYEDELLPAFLDAYKRALPASEDVRWDPEKYRRCMARTEFVLTGRVNLAHQPMPRARRNASATGASGTQTSNYPADGASRTFPPTNQNETAMPLESGSTTMPGGGQAPFTGVTPLPPSQMAPAQNDYAQQIMQPTPGDSQQWNMEISEQDPSMGTVSFSPPQIAPVPNNNPWQNVSLMSGNSQQWNMEISEQYSFMGADPLLQTALAPNNNPWQNAPPMFGDSQQ